MSLIMYLIRAPKYENISAEQIMLIESYLSWKNENAKNGKYSCDTFEKWCGHSESELPNKDVINYYKQFWTLKTTYMEYVGETQCFSIFEQLMRFAKANPMINWFYHNVMGDNVISKDYCEVSEKQLNSLFKICNTIKNNGITLIEKNKHGIESLNEYAVNEDIAKQLLPTNDNKNGYMGPNAYDSFYAYQVIYMENKLSEILKSTDFAKQTIYFSFANV